MGDYVGDVTPHAKRSSGVKYRSRMVFPFLLPQILLTSRSQTVQPIFMLFYSLDVNPRFLHFYRDKTAKGVPLRSFIPHNIETHISSKTTMLITVTFFSQR